MVAPLHQAFDALCQSVARRIERHSRIAQVAEECQCLRILLQDYLTAMRIQRGEPTHHRQERPLHPLFAARRSPGEVFEEALGLVWRGDQPSKPLGC
ncbi:hypothetical protein D9M72_417460 [compost metagenome]